MRKVAALLLLAAAACAHQPRTQKYTVVMAGRQAGSQTVTVDGAQRTIDYEYNDRGRGPKTHTVLTPGAIAVTGNDYYKAPVDEKFTRGAEDGFYVSMYGPPEELAALARALLAAPGQKLPLLPAGEASIKRLGETTVGGKRLTAYDISGLGFTPATIWLDERGELFANASSWISVITQGHEAAIPRLVKVQDDWQAAAARETASRLIHKPSGGGLVITNARVFDPVTRSVQPPANIVIRGSHIESVGASDAAELEHLDAGGRVVLPGLWDMHAHAGGEDGALNIAAGVTTVRDMGNDIDYLLDLKKKWDLGEAVGPRVVLAGIMDGPGPLAGPTKMLAANEDEARAVIDKYASLGFEQIKVYSSIKPELVPFITRHAHERGLRVSGHVPAFMRAEEAVRAGYDELQHANFLFLNFFEDVKDTRTPTRFTAVAERAATLDVASPEARAFIELLRERKIVVDPTLALFEQMFTARKGTMSPGYAAIADRLPPQVRRGYLAGGLWVPEGMDQRYRDSFANMLRMVRALYDAGVPLVAGTDAMAGFALHRELELYVQAGIPAPEVLRIATLGAATVMKREATLGTIASGKLADLVIVEGDPAANISDVRRVRMVVKDGNVFDAAAVGAAIGVGR
jgi:imidazolonepropionase-like amidohydrolase